MFGFMDNASCDLFVCLSPGFVYMTWSMPLMIVVALYMLWGTLGAASMAGLAVLVLLLPTNMVVAYKQKAYQVQLMKVKDSRIKIMNEVLNGMKVIKRLSSDVQYVSFLCLFSGYSTYYCYDYDDFNKFHYYYFHHHHHHHHHHYHHNFTIVIIIIVAVVAVVVVVIIIIIIIIIIVIIIIIIIIVIMIIQLLLFLFLS